MRTAASCGENQRSRPTKNRETTSKHQGENRLTERIHRGARLFPPRSALKRESVRGVWSVFVLEGTNSERKMAACFLHRGAFLTIGLPAGRCARPHADMKKPSREERQASCGRKRRYRSQGDALEAAALLGLERQRMAYLCPLCSRWHLASATGRNRRGY